MNYFFYGAMTGFAAAIFFWIRDFKRLARKYELLRNDCEVVVKDNAQLRRRNLHLESSLKTPEQKLAVQVYRNGVNHG